MESVLRAMIATIVHWFNELFLIQNTRALFRYYISYSRSRFSIDIQKNGHRSYYMPVNKVNSQSARVHVLRLKFTMYLEPWGTRPKRQSDDTESFDLLDHYRSRYSASSRHSCLYAIVWPLATIIIVARLRRSLERRGWRVAPTQEMNPHRESRCGKPKFAVVALFGNAINPQVLLNCSSVGKIAYGFINNQ